MSLIQKKDEEREVIDGIEIIESGDAPDDLPTTDYDLVAGKSAEDIAAASDEPSADRAGSHFGPKSAADDEDDTDAALGEDDELDEDDEDLEDDATADAGTSRRGMFAVLAVVAVVVAAIVGYFVGSGGLFRGAAGADSGSLTADQLDTVIARYTYNGASHDITAREVIESQYSLEAVEQEDGTYPTPSADSAVAYARNQILLAEAESRGIEATEDEMAEYAEQSIGTSDFAEMADRYQLSEDQAREVVRENTVLQKLYTQVVPENDATMPEAPVEPEDGDTSTRSKEYADYIIGLAGDEWDAESGTWASQDGPFYSVLSDTDFTADSASYEQALTAYYTAYQEYAEASGEYTSMWAEFQNGLFANADIDLYGLFA
ncbi:hypothetical protein [Collinsella tanakaei]|uniref:hypothetical protein n=1 Tax=Collinsella tanakaei TaxID=626935 RepID=UPI0025A400C2|nr:hypothetical protein [Collinsella tanakaei]MDM8300856.1 hypothetical protein [Collinsella tanakaei]